MCMDWLQEQAQPIIESGGHDRKKLCYSCDFCCYLQWKKIPIFNWYSYISLTLFFCSQAHMHKKHFPKRRTCIWPCKTSLLPSYCGEGGAFMQFFLSPQMSSNIKQFSITLQRMERHRNYASRQQWSEAWESIPTFPVIARHTIPSPLLFWLELSHLHLTWYSLRSILFSLFI